MAAIQNVINKYQKKYFNINDIQIYLRYFKSSIHTMDLFMNGQKMSCLRIIGLDRATFFMMRVGFRACSFGRGWAQVTGNLHGLISGHNISNLGHIQAAFGPPLYMNNVNKTQKCNWKYNLLQIYLKR